MTETFNFRVKDGKQITVRLGPAVVAGDYVGTLAPKEPFYGTVAINKPDEIWIKLTDKFHGFYCAIRYKGKDFADILNGPLPIPEPNPDPEPIPSSGPITVTASVTPDGKLQIIVDDPNRLPIHSIWVNNVEYYNQN